MSVNRCIVRVACGTLFALVGCSRTPKEPPVAMAATSEYVVPTVKDAQTANLKVPDVQRKVTITNGWPDTEPELPPVPEVATEVKITPTHNKRHHPRVEPTNLQGSEIDVLNEVFQALDKLEQPVEPFVVRRISDVIPLRSDGWWHPANPVCLSADGSRLAVLDHFEGCTLWDTATSKKIHRFTYPTTKKFPEAKHLDGHLALTSDGQHVVISGHFKGVRVYEAETGKLVVAHEDHAEPIKDLKLSGNDKWLAVLENYWHLSHYPLLGGAKREIKAHQRGLPKYNDTYGLSHDGSLLAVHDDGTNSTVLFHFSGTGRPTSEGFNTYPGPHRFAFSRNHFAKLSLQGQRVLLYLLGPDGEAVPIQQRSAGPSSLLKLSDDDRYVIRGTSSTLFYLPLDVDARPWKITLDSPPGYIREVSADGKTLVQDVSSIHAVCWRVPELPRSTEAQWIDLVHHYIENLKYDHLEVLGHFLEEDREPFPWNLGEPRYQTFVNLLQSHPFTGTSEIGQKYIETWLRVRPKSQLARMLKAMQHIDVGWAARGGGWAKDVSKEGWLIFNAQLYEAQELLMPMLEEENPPPHVFSLLLSIARGASWPLQKREQVRQAFFEQAAWYGPAYDHVIESMQPRWSGKKGDSARFAQGIYDTLGEEEGCELYLRMACMAQKFYPLGQLLQNEPFDPQILQIAIENLRKKYPAHPSLPLYEMWTQTMRINPDPLLCRQLNLQMPKADWEAIPLLTGSEVNDISKRFDQIQRQTQQ